MNYQIILPTYSSSILSHFPHSSYLSEDSASDHQVNKTKKVSAVGNEETDTVHD